MALNYFNVRTTRRLSIGLLAAAGALLFAALDLVGVGISANDKTYAAKISASVSPLAFSALAALIALIAAEVAEHPDTPSEGHPHSKSNYLQTAFAMLLVLGLGNLIWGGYILISAAVVQDGSP